MGEASVNHHFATLLVINVGAGHAYERTMFRCPLEIHLIDDTYELFRHYSLCPPRETGTAARSPRCEAFSGRFYSRRMPSPRSGIARPTGLAFAIAGVRSVS